jgi:peptide/nickel transport system permease protein
MVGFLVRRFITMVITLATVSVIVFIVIEIPPGDFAERYAFNKAEAGLSSMTEETLQGLREQYGLDKPVYQRYWRWVTGIVTRGDFGISFNYMKPVTAVVGERIWYTVAIALFSVILTYGVAIPIGIYSAVHQYSVGDYGFTIIGYIGLAIPQFLVAILLLYFGVTVLDMNVGGLFSPGYREAPWSFDRAVDFAKHVWIPAIVLGSYSTTFQIRTMRATMLDEKNELYVLAARARGLAEGKLLIKYPARMALNPIVSTIGWELATVISGAPIVSLVLNIPDTGPLFLNALLDQDLYLAGSMLLMLSALIVFGTFLSDILLVVLDPRTRYGQMAA